MAADDDVAEALDGLQRALGAAQGAAAAMAAIEQIQERFDAAIRGLADEPDIWDAAAAAHRDAKGSLDHLRGCLEELQSQIARRQTSDLQSRVWAEQIVKLNWEVQDHLTTAGQHTARFYELLRPTLIRRYLDHATRTSRWVETWPVDADEAKRALGRLCVGGDASQLEALDCQLAQLRWDVGWAQQRIAQVAGLSQPSVAARLARVEQLVSLEVGCEHVRRQGEAEGYRMTRRHISSSRGPRDPIGELVLEADSRLVQLDVLVASGESGTSKRGAVLDRGLSLDLLRLEAAGSRQAPGRQITAGLAVYYRDRGVIGYFTTHDAAQTVRLLGRLPAETVLQRMRESVVSARTLDELAQRAETTPAVPAVVA